MAKRRAVEKWSVFAGFILIVILLRLAMTPFLSAYIHEVLDDMPGYHADFHDLHVSFFTGGYTIDSLAIYRGTIDKEHPFVIIPRVDWQIRWLPLLFGKPVAEIVFTQPQVNFDAVDGKRTRLVNWSRLCKNASILPVDQVNVKDGTLRYTDHTVKPFINITFKNVRIESSNFANVVDRIEGPLPSWIIAQAHCSGNGSLRVMMRLNPLKQQPDLDMELGLENMELTEIEEFLSVYARTNALKGKMKLYSRLVVIDGRISGYVTPEYDNVAIHDKMFYGAAMEGTQEGEKSEVVGNRIATQILLNERIHSAEYWAAIWGAFCRASREGLQQNARKLESSLHKQGKLTNNP